jgi:AmiR/NasT family two-component response regulator
MLVAAAQTTITRIPRDILDAPRLAALRSEIDGLRTAMASRSTIEQAKGIIMATTRCSPDEAFRVLVGQSQHQNRKLREVARDLVCQSQRRLS